ncbi:type I-C CRISPR-associated endonuclease Cas1 [Comamonadaceae bacterium OH2310_COT-174]|nr:type I-C CRISPR-associated endonuclease Cas1 [Comamonadaceae bacterium OH2310_COT-174]
MRPLLNTLYITTEGAWLRKDGENLVVEVEGQTRARLPVHMLQGLVCIGHVLVSPALMGHCAQRGICISHLSPSGRFLARVEGPVSGNVLLRRAQYRCSDQNQGAAIARHIVAGKVFNQRAVLARALRDHASGMAPAAAQALQHATLRLKRISQQARTCADTDTLRGLEGEAAQLYFSVFDHLIRVDEPALRFTGRSRRPPRDAVNALLSLLYTLLTHDCRGALETVGLDPAIGFLHRDRPGRPSLALDLMEEFRPVLADRLALSLINRRQIGPRDFQTLDNGAVLLKDDARKTVLTAWQERKRDPLQHSFTGESAPIGLFPFVQAQLLARHLRGDLDAYPPFIWK